MKIEIKKEKQSLPKKLNHTLELLTLVGALCSLFLIMYVAKLPNQAQKQENEELTYVFKETELYDILDFDQIENEEENNQ